MKTRRKFLRSCCTPLVGAAAASLTRLGLIDAHAQSGGGYKALVCVFLFGGSDGNNMVVPMDDEAYRRYASGRGVIALGRDALLPIQAQGRAYGIHSRLSDLHQLYGARRLALVANVGTLVKPVTRLDLDDARTPVPRNLFSHSDQTTQWQSSNPLGSAGTGWGGRTIDHVVGRSESSLPAAISFAGNSLLLVGSETQPASLGDGGAFGLESIDESGPDLARLSALDQILHQDEEHMLAVAMGGVMRTSLDGAKEIRALFASAPPIRTVFPDSGLARQLKQVAQMIAVRGARGLTRQIFFCSQGGYDNHSDLLASQDDRFADLGPALAAFYKATEEMGVADRVTTFTESEFGRTFGPSSTAGSDHAWGSHHMVLGGAVKGGEMAGRFPDLRIGGAEDAGDRGAWIPSTSLDQYAATLATWFGLQAGDLPAVFPNLANFSEPNLGLFEGASSCRGSGNGRTPPGCSVPRQSR